MHSRLLPLPVPEAIELLELPREFDGLHAALVDIEIEADVSLSLELARQRQEQLQVIEVDDPTTTTFAMFI